MADSSLNYHTYAAPVAWKDFQEIQTSEAGPSQNVSESSTALLTVLSRPRRDQRQESDLRKALTLRSTSEGQRPAMNSSFKSLQGVLPTFVDLIGYPTMAHNFVFPMYQTTATCLCFVLELQSTTFITLNYPAQGQDSERPESNF